MVRRAVLIAVAGVLLGAPSAHAAGYGKVVVARCDRVDRSVVFEGRMGGGAGRMQMRFTLQAQTPDEPGWQKVGAPGFGAWITAPAGARAYIYDKTVENLVAPAAYRAVVQFRWRGAHGRVTRQSRATSRTCRQPDPRPNLVVRQVRVDAAAAADRRRYVAVIANTGRGDAGAFAVALTRDGAPLGTAPVDELGAGETTTVAVTGPGCAPGQVIGATADAAGTVDEADEFDNLGSLTC